MNNKEKTISVVMCTYNGARYLREQMESILAQDLMPTEIIVRDDCSGDDTLDLLRSYRDAYPNLFRISVNEQRLGFNRNFHTALLCARGDYIAISDQDDIWFPSKLRRQLETIGTADVCLSDYFTDPAFEEPLHVRVHPNLNFENLLFYDCTPGHTMLLRRDFVHRITEWNYDIYYDWWLSVHAHMGRGIVCVDEPLNWHRHHPGSATTHIFRKGRWEAVAHPTWQPYVYGTAHRLHLQRKHNWQFFYRYLRDHIDAARHPLARTIAACMVSRSPLALVRLCCLCGRHFHRVYPGRPHGISGCIHGFFYPLISAYGNDLFKLEP